MSRRNDREASRAYLDELRNSDTFLYVLLTVLLAPLYAASRAFFWIERKVGRWEEWK